MPKRKHDRGAHHPGGRSDSVREQRDVSDTEGMTGRPHDPDAERDVMSGAMGGTSDAGTAADDAAEAAALDIGLPDDRTRQTGSEAKAERRAEGDTDTGTGHGSRHGA